MAFGNIGRQMIVKLRSISAFKKILILGSCVALLFGCGQNFEVKSACQLSNRWNLSSARTSKVLSDIETESDIEIREALTETVATLVAFNDVAPRAIKSDVEILLSTYGTLFDAMQALDWQGSLSLKDATVASVGVRLGSDEIANAQTNFANFFEENCSQTIDNAIIQFSNVGTTLPDPVIQDQDSKEPLDDPDSEGSIARALGFVVVERFGVAITDQQAICVGDSLLAATSLDSLVVDETYWQLLQTIFETCEVKIDVAKFLKED